MLARLAAKKQDIKELEKLSKELRKNTQNLTALRGEISLIQEESKALKEISELEGVLSIPIMLTILDDIKKINEAKLQETFKTISGEDLKTVKEKTVEVSLKRILGSDVKSSFETFIEKNISEVTPENVKELINTMAKVFRSKAFKNVDKDEGLDQQFVDYFETEIFLICAHALYKDVDEKQMANIVSLGWAMKSMTAEKIRKPFLAVSHCAKHVQVTSETKELWREFALWLEALYWRIYNLIPETSKNEKTEVIKGTDGYPTVDDQDLSFKAHFKMTKYDMALYHRSTAENLKSQIRIFGKLLNQEIAAVTQSESNAMPVKEIETNIPDSNSPSPAELTSNEPTQFTLKKPLKEGIEQITQGNMIYVVTAVPIEKRSKAVEITAINQYLLNSNLAMVDDSEIYFSLEVQGTGNNEKDDEVKITKLENCAKKYLLNKYESELAFIVKEVESKFTQYIQNVYIRTRKHASEAETKINEMKAETNPNQRINKLIEFRYFLEAQGSTDLLPILNRILLKTHTILFDTVRPKIQYGQQVDMQQTPKILTTPYILSQSLLPPPQEKEKETVPNELQTSKITSLNRVQN